MIHLSAPRLCVSALFILSLSMPSHAARTNWFGKAHANPAIARAIERRTMAPAKPRVVMQRAADGEVVSVMADGTVVREPLKRAATARIPEALGRVRIDAALARIAAAVEADDNAKRAAALERLADKLEREQRSRGRDNVALLGGIAAASGAAAYGLRRWTQKRLEGAA
jgi:hypothetical protein